MTSNSSFPRATPDEALRDMDMVDIFAAVRTVDQLKPWCNAMAELSISPEPGDGYAPAFITGDAILDHIVAWANEWAVSTTHGSGPRMLVELRAKPPGRDAWDTQRRQLFTFWYSITGMYA